ncbi:disulfide bond formation protein B [Silanimonas sp.]|uniref:disulfide bond formation protein B n=1 Tax=Silanimonas sp. TaxID=1929290 RepID=UPI001BBE88AD|nr:disulfide bond formation protein B [Silanimonas sp.]MBS3896545.1 disulfide bond formation protein B [Silanimonas sp.]
MNPNPFAWSFRLQMGFGFAVCVALLGFALYVEHGMFMLPCPLCMLQRFVFAAIGLLGLVAALHNPSGRRGRGGRAAYGIALAALAALGASIAARHAWLQMQPISALPSCSGQGLAYMWEALGPIDALAASLAGSADCAKIDWTFLGLSMPIWTFVCFVLLGIGALVAGLRRRVN